MSEISVVVVGSTSISSVVGNGDTVNVNVGNQTVSGGNGAAATIEAGSVATVDATQTATVTNVGTAYAAKFNFSLPRGFTGGSGPANSLSVGSVSTGTTAAVSISGTAPSQQLSFVLQPGPAGPANSLSIGSVSTGTTAAVSISGSAPSQSISFVLPQGPAGSPNSLSIGSVSTGATAAVSITGAAPSQSLSFVLQPGPTGPANSLSIGSVSTGTTAAVSISGTAPSQSLSFVLQPGPVGPANSLSIGSVSTGATAAVSISGTAPSQSVSFVLPVGPKGDTGPVGPAGPPINLGDETPQPLGVASAGTALNAARADHVHAAGSIAYSSLSGIPSTFAPSAHSHAVSDVTGLQTALDGKQVAGAYAPLVNSLIPSSYLPSFVDDVIDAGGTLPATGDVGKIYVVSTGGSANKIYRWSGSTFIEISPSPGSTDSVTEGSVNLYHTTARAAAAAPVQSVAGRTGTITLAQLASSGTASSTTFLRGDGAWAAVSGASVVDGGTFVGVVPSITISQQPADVSISINQGSTGAASFSVAASSSTGASVSYQWQRLVGSAWSYIDGATLSTLTLAGLTGADDGASYRCLVNSLNAPELASNPASLAVIVIAPSAPVIAISSQPQAATILSTQSVASFSVSASATQSAAVTYQWQRRSAGSAIWQNVSSGTASTLSLTGLTYQQDNRSSYRCQVNAQGASSVYSNTADLVIAWAAAPQITLASASTAASLGSANYLFSATQSLAFLTAADSIVGGTTVTYQWEISRYGRNNFSTQTFHSAAGSTTARTIRTYNSLIGSGSYDLRCVITATNSYGTTVVTTGVFSYSVISV